MKLFPEDPLISKIKVSADHKCNWRLLRQPPPLPHNAKNTMFILASLFFFGYFSENTDMREAMYARKL